MKTYSKIFAALLALGMPFMAAAEEEPQWLSGVYVNQDQGALADELTFCPAGKALFSSILAAYVVEGKDDGRVVTLYSNGAFTLKVADNGNQLLPADDFTRQWLTKSSLKRDTRKQDECKSGY